MPDRREADGPTELDLNAAWLRKARGDLRPFMAALAARLEDSLPGRVDVERKRDGFFSSTSHVAGITVRLDPDVFVLTADRGLPVARRQKTVHGVQIRSDEMDVPTWLEAVTGAVARVAGDAEAARTALHDLLMA